MYVGILLCDGGVFCEYVLYAISTQGGENKVSEMFSDVRWLVRPVVCMGDGVVEENVGV